MEKLKIDVDNRLPFLKRIYLRQGDGGIQTVLINVVSGDDPVDCTGYTVKFKANLCDGKLVTGEAEPKDLTNGEYTYTFKSAESSVYGDVRNAYFQLYDELGNSISGSNVLITVEKGVDITQDQADGYVSELDKIIDSVQGKADELAEFAEEEKGKITDEVSGVSEFAESQKGLMTEAVTDVQTFAESEKNDITSIKNDVSGFADEQKATMADKTGEVANYGDIQKVAMLNKRLEIEQTGNQEKAKILAVLPDVKSSIAEQAEQIADLQEALSDVSLHQAWMAGENGDVSNTFGENLLTDTLPNKLPKLDGRYKVYPTFSRYDDFGYVVFSPTTNVLPYYFVGSYSEKEILSVDFLNKIRGKKLLASADIAVKNYNTINPWNAGISIYCWGPDGELKTSDSKKTKYDNERIFVDMVIPEGTLNVLVAIRAFPGANTNWQDVEMIFGKIKLEIASDEGLLIGPPIYTPAIINDPINCYPKYVGFGIKASDNYQDYRWILNPEWVNANAIYGTEITTLKDQLADIQVWIQAHS